jgi:hypothetical protein
VVQLGDGVRFAFELLAEVRILRQMRRQNLDRNRTIETRVARLVDFAHPAGSDRRQDFVWTEARTGRQQFRSELGLDRASRGAHVGGRLRAIIAGP